MKKSLKIIVILTLILLLGVSVIIGISSSKNDTEKISIVATNFPAYDFARAVAGDTADIKMLVKPGAEIQDFEPTPQDIIDIKNSKMFIYTGGESDEWIEDVLDNIDVDKTKLFKMMGSVSVVEEETVEGMEEEREDNDGREIEYDEHVWTSIKNASKIIENIENELIKISPENREIFEKNTKEYIKKLTDLDLKFKEIVEMGSRETIVFGDRFPLRYFVDDYGLDYFAAFPGCSDQTEASSKTIAFLVEKIKNEHLPVVFKIEMSGGNIAQTIADETGAKVLTFHTAHNVSADDFKNGITYAKIMEDNLKVLKEALN